MKNGAPADEKSERPAIAPRANREENARRELPKRNTPHPDNHVARQHQCHYTQHDQHRPDIVRHGKIDDAQDKANHDNPSECFHVCFQTFRSFIAEIHPGVTSNISAISFWK